MNQSNASTRCPHCHFLNFVTQTYCKRCKNSLVNQSSGDGNSINININLNTSAQPRLNTQVNGFPPQNQQFQPHFQQAPPPQQFQQPPQQHFQTPPQTYAPPTEYQLQNQAGFQQWQQNHSRTHQPPPYGNHYQHQYAPVQMPSVWRHGSEAVIHRYTGSLPNHCAKCGEHISGYNGGAYVGVKYRWHHPLVYIALISPLIYCILSAVLSQRITVEVPLCQQHLEDRKNVGNILIGAGIAATCLTVLFASFGALVFTLFLVLASIVGISLAYEYLYKPIQVSKIENDFIFLKNADTEFLNRLPQY